ncbi:dihydrolipoyl dehydrogenase [Methanofollis formosanus]|uniref:Dihydrolipoyl dehydrogenase n=1 Tax=Methanofollis formosanus TaxID=299308 RepID=A0A8G1A3G1_9EURY|nr:dihydrolipoyl dehydrogenase [Methanofollis formosanus]QYZ80346.1 dihydrolipoyl dehydrogenase [Methanofollis formosanus]
MKEYDLIAVGSGSAMPVVEAYLEDHPKARAAVVDKDAPGGICLTRGCIPSKMLLYPAELVRMVERAAGFGVKARLEEVDFAAVMERMRTSVQEEVAGIRASLESSPDLDYYQEVAEFTAPYTLSVGGTAMHAPLILLCTGSRPAVPPVAGLEEVGYLTSDTLLELEELPESVAVIGGGYIAAEYGHFLAAMGAAVTVIGRNPRFLPSEEPEVSALARRALGRHLAIVTGHEVRRAGRTANGQIRLTARDRIGGTDVEFVADAVLVASGRRPNTDLLHPEQAGIRTDTHGWIAVDEYLQTSSSNVWAFGDANGKSLFKHVGNYEAKIVYLNAVLGERVKAAYDVVPHAVFTDPEIAAVGLAEQEAVERYGEDGILIGFQRYDETAKGMAMGVKDGFVKVILERATLKILGAHIIGPSASVLIQEVVTAMYLSGGVAEAVMESMHIHPALSEVVQRAFLNLMTPSGYASVIGRSGPERSE